MTTYRDDIEDAEESQHPDLTVDHVEATKEPGHNNTGPVQQQISDLWKGSDVNLSL